ncbi:MAG: hypothetical protein RLY31_1049 [Bacteroidota bacterium]
MHTAWPFAFIAWLDDPVFNFQSAAAGLPPAAMVAGLPNPEVLAPQPVPGGSPERLRSQWCPPGYVVLQRNRVRQSPASTVTRRRNPPTYRRRCAQRTVPRPFTGNRVTLAEQPERMMTKAGRTFRGGGDAPVPVHSELLPGALPDQEADFVEQAFGDVVPIRLLAQAKEIAWRMDGGYFRQYLILVFVHLGGGPPLRWRRRYARHASWVAVVGRLWQRTGVLPALPMTKTTAYPAAAVSVECNLRFLSRSISKTRMAEWSFLATIFTPQLGVKTSRGMNAPDRAVNSMVEVNRP